MGLTTSPVIIPYPRVSSFRPPSAPSIRRSAGTDFEDETREVARLGHRRMHGVVAARTSALDHAVGTRRVGCRRGHDLQPLTLAHVVRALTADQAAARADLVRDPDI